jgi:argininosuccinate synthase
MSRAVLAFSGGLDTRYCAVWLREELGHDVVTVTVDTGGLREDDHLRLAERSAACGAVEHVLVDGRRRVWDECVSWLIRGNVLRGGVYPVCVGAERLVQADETANVARAQDASIVAHGSPAPERRRPLRRGAGGPAAGGGDPGAGPRPRA